ncbi:MAG: hypothetical protein ACLFT5_07860 [Desulfovermiculus sp.]
MEGLQHVCRGVGHLCRSVHAQGILANNGYNLDLVAEPDEDPAAEKKAAKAGQAKKLAKKLRALAFEPEADKDES